MLYESEERQLAFSLSLIDEWYRSGVRQAVICPGSRSTPLTLALLMDERFEITIRLDERSAGFFAVGLAMASLKPVVILVTSGTAAAELHPAVVEADLAQIPVIVCTSDRPAELHDVFAPQTIGQDNLYGSSVRYFYDAQGVFVSEPHVWRSIAARLAQEAIANPKGPGPVHLNLPFSEPFFPSSKSEEEMLSNKSESLSDTGEIVNKAVLLQAFVDEAKKLVIAGRSNGQPWHLVYSSYNHDDRVFQMLLDFIKHGLKVVIIAGWLPRPKALSPFLALRQLAKENGWVIFADPRAWPRTIDGVSIFSYDTLVRSDTVTSGYTPDLVVHVGQRPSSKALTQWCRELHSKGIPHIRFDPYQRFIDPERYISHVIKADIELVAQKVLESEKGKVSPENAHALGKWQHNWLTAEKVCQDTYTSLLYNEEQLTEPKIARFLYQYLSPTSTIVASSSMPIRNLEFFAGPRLDAPHVLANRGANGIDGVTSTILGVAKANRKLQGAQTIGFLGDLAFLHDTSGLIWGQFEEKPDVTLVVVDNNGGAIFSYLPIYDMLPGDYFERAFATPHRFDAEKLVTSLGHHYFQADSINNLAKCLDTAQALSGIKIIFCPVQRDLASENSAFWVSLAQQKVNEVLK